MQIRITLLFQCFMLSSAKCDIHTLEFLSTGRVQPGDRPQFEQLTVFDGVPISYCDSLKKREELKSTLESNNFPEYCHEASYNILDSLYEIPPLLSSTVYVVQRRRGCTQSANGTVSAFEGWAVNGMDFISFDPASQRWMSQSPSAVRLKHHWNNSTARNFAFRHFITTQCPLMMQRIKLKPTHQKTELYVFAKPIVDRAQALLRCHVTSTDKSLSSLHLIGDGASKASWISVIGPMPSEDGSVILRLTAGISLSQNTDTYGCEVQAGGHNITVFWDGKTLDGRNLLNMAVLQWNAVILGFFCIMLLIILISHGTILLLKFVKRKSRRPATVDLQLIEQFARIRESVTSPDLQSVIAACIQGTERNREWEQWLERTILAEQNFYDAEHFAHQDDGAQ
ncbi:major histocompatibility complex class I-related gene protein-like [Chaetodon trifascialis]|uniref:major histocompatibility complex class I-related gene protein-like n=1 Tax=Chaetodon trifascialis TaxID=109706 RepID=UPI00399554AA